MSFLKNLKVRSSVPDKSQPLSTRTAHTPRLSAADELLRFMADDDGVIYDTVELKKILPTDPDYQTAFKRAQGLNRLVAAADARRSRLKAAEVQGVIEKSKELLQLLKLVYPPEPPVLGDLFEFNPENPKYLDRMPKIMNVV